MEGVEVISFGSMETVLQEKKGVALATLKSIIAKVQDKEYKAEK